MQGKKRPRQKKAKTQQNAFRQLRYKSIDDAVAREAVEFLQSCPAATACVQFYSNVLLSSTARPVRVGERGGAAEEELAFTPYYEALVTAHLMPALNAALPWLFGVGCVPVFFEHVVNLLTGTAVTVPVVPVQSMVDVQVAQRCDDEEEEEDGNGGSDGYSSSSSNSSSSDEEKEDGEIRHKSKSISANVGKKKKKKKLSNNNVNGMAVAVANDTACTSYYSRHYRVLWRTQAGLATQPFSATTGLSDARRALCGKNGGDSSDDDDDDDNKDNHKKSSHGKRRKKLRRQQLSVVVANFTELPSPTEGGELKTPVVTSGLPGWRRIKMLEGLWMQQLHNAANPLVLIEQLQMTATDRNAHDLQQLGLTAGERADRAAMLTAEDADVYSGGPAMAAMAAMAAGGGGVPDGDAAASEVAFSSSGVNMLRLNIGTDRKAAVPDGYKLAHVGQAPTAVLDILEERRLHQNSVSRVLNLPPGLLLGSEGSGGGGLQQSSHDELITAITNAAICNAQRCLEHVATTVLRRCITLDVLRCVAAEGVAEAAGSSSSFEPVIADMDASEHEALVANLFVRLDPITLQTQQEVKERNDVEKEKEKAKQQQERDERMIEAKEKEKEKDRQAAKEAAADKAKADKVAGMAAQKK